MKFLCAASFCDNQSHTALGNEKEMSFEVRELGVLSQLVHRVQLFQGKRVVAVCSGRRFPMSQSLLGMNITEVSSSHCSLYALPLLKKKV